MNSTQEERPCSETSGAAPGLPGAALQRSDARAFPGSGSIIVTIDGRVLSLTPGSVAILLHFGLGRIENGALKLFDPRVDDLLHKAAHRDLEHGEEAECRAVFGDVLTGSVRLSASRLDLAEPRPGVPPDPTLLVSLMVVAPRPSVPEEFAACGLTMTEQEIALAYGAGGSVKGISLERGRGIETIRTQLKTAMNKLGIHRQVELALIVARSHETR